MLIYYLVEILRGAGMTGTVGQGVLVVGITDHPFQHG